MLRGARYKLVQFAVPHYIRTDERVTQLHLLFNRLLREEPASRSRRLSLAIAVGVPITPRVRLLQVRSYWCRVHAMCIIMELPRSLTLTSRSHSSRHTHTGSLLVHLTGLGV